MSRQNKVNPGQYTQRGRLTQDDAGREISKQRSIGSQHTWQPVQKDQMPRPRRAAKDNDADRDAETSEHNNLETMPPSGRAKPAAPGKAQSAKASAAKNTTGRAKTGKAVKPAAKKATATATARKAVLARNVGGGGSKSRQTTKRRKS